MYAIFGIFGWLFIFFLLPETRGVPLEDIPGILDDGWIRTKGPIRTIGPIRAKKYEAFENDESAM